MKSLLAIFGITILLIACTKDKTLQPTCQDTVSFSSTIKPLIQQNCSTSGCHDATASGGVNLVSYLGINSNAERILNVIQLPENDPKFMPLGSNKLEESLIEQISCWIEQGKLNN